jgi:hypothetical protein
MIALIPLVKQGTDHVSGGPASDRLPRLLRSEK